MQPTSGMSTTKLDAAETIIDNVVESVLSTEEHSHELIPEVNAADTIDILFGGVDVPRTKHLYEDGVTVEILNLGNDEASLTPAWKSYNGSRVFYKDIDGEKRVLCRFPGYAIEKYVVSTNANHSTVEDTTEGVNHVLEYITRDLTPETLGALCLTNDGPLLLVFKVNGKVRLHMMRSASHGFDDQFSEDFAEQYNGATFADLFSVSIETSPWCHLFRQGSRTSAMAPPQDQESHTLLYLGGLECNMVSITPPAADGVPAVLMPSVCILSVETAVSILRNHELGLVCYRHPGGEVQFMAESYLQRVATMTGVSMDELIEGVSPPEDTRRSSLDEFVGRPSALIEGNLTARLTSSRFPRILDLFSLYVLCGTNPTRKLATVSGFSVRVSPGNRILATPKRGFYNFCRAAGVNPRRELAFPATPSAMRLAVRRIILSASLESRTAEIEQQFDDYETVMVHLVPMLVARALGGPSELTIAFEAAFGITAAELVGSLPLEGPSPTLRSIRSALLLGDNYRLVTIGRFALRYLLNSEFTPSAMRREELISLLSDYSHSSRRRRQVAESVNAPAEQ